MMRCSKNQFVGILTIVAVCSLIFASTTNAQGIPASGGIELTQSPNNPKPGQDVKITARSYNIEINSAKISWSVNGSVKQSDVGATTYTVKAPDLGKIVNITVSATTPSGSTISGSISIKSGSVDMLVESDGYVPPLFLGKIAPVYQNNVKVIAIPHIANSSGKEYDPKTMVYQWKKNGQVLESQSGYGKQSITLKGELVPRPYSLSVTASTGDGGAEVVGTAPITPQNPIILFYINDPLYGALYNVVIGNTLRLGTQKETGVIAVPFGFNKYPGKDNLSMTWLINNVSHPELSANQSITLRAPSDAGGSSDIILDIKNKTDILQGAKAGFSASFSADPQNNQTDSVTL